MPDKTIRLSVDLTTGDYLLILPPDFDFVGPDADLVDAMLSPLDERRRAAA